MTSFTCRTDVAAPPERAFDVFSDLRRAPERVRGIHRLEILGDGRVGEGTRFRETRILYGRKATEEMVISAFEAPHRYVAETRSHGTHFVTEFRFVPIESGTRVELVFTATPFSFPARILAFLSRAMARSLRRAMEQDLLDLKRAAEAR